jgi:hypothetical protein
MQKRTRSILALNSLHSILHKLLHSKPKPKPAISKPVLSPKPMTVGDLIAKLSEFDLSQPVSVKIYTDRCLSLYEDVLSVSKECVVVDYSLQMNVVLAVSDHHIDHVLKLIALDKIIKSKGVIADA